MIERFANRQLRETLSDTPVVLIHGCRQCGKTTLAKAMTKDGYSYITFDDEKQLEAARQDPVGFIDFLPPKVIIDEVQRVPELFRSIKKKVDETRTPGRFLLTGSCNVFLLPQLADSLAGRMEVVTLYPFAQCEIEGRANGFLDWCFSGERRQVPHSGREGLNLFHRVCLGGYPEPQTRATERRQRSWFKNYINAIIQRDIRDLSRIRDLAAIPTLLSILGTRTGQLSNTSEISNSLKFTRPTTEHYITTLQNVFLVSSLKPWFSNRGKRLVKSPKLHLADSGLAWGATNYSVKQLIGEKTFFGQLLETFVYTEIQKLVSWHDTELELFHFRDTYGNEVDIVLEDCHGNLVGIEVKSAGSVKNSDFKGLRKLNEICETMIRGIVLYDGDSVLPFGDNMYAVPLSAFWS